MPPLHSGGQACIFRIFVYTSCGGHYIIVIQLLQMIKHIANLIQKQKTCRPQSIYPTSFSTKNFFVFVSLNFPSTFMLFSHKPLQTHWPSAHLQMHLQIFCIKFGRTGYSVRCFPAHNLLRLLSLFNWW